VLVTLRNQRDHYEHWPALQLPLRIMRLSASRHARLARLSLSIALAAFAAIAIAFCWLAGNSIAKFAGSMVSAGRSRITLEFHDPYRAGVRSFG
jgi:hypothetical protein